MAELIVAGKWNAPHGNGPLPDFDAPPPTGIHLVDARGGHASDTDTVIGTGVGEVSGNAFLLTVTWSNGARSVYTGAIQRNERLAGSSRDRGQPNHPASRFSYRTFR